ncbi:DMT family transporter [Corynebacterium sp. 335C]
MLSIVVAVTLGLLSALSVAAGTVIRHQLADILPEEDAGLRGVWAVISRPAWWGGVGLAILGYVFQVGALAFGSLLLVQPLLVMKLMFTLPLSARVNGRRISIFETAWAAVLTVAVGVLVILGRPTEGSGAPGLHVWIPSLVIGTVVFWGMFLLARTRLPGDRALMLGLATGFLYGFFAVLGKAVVDVAVHEGLGAAAMAWQLWLLVALMVIGTMAQQAAFNAGPLSNSLPAMTTAEPVTAFVLGYAILGERFQVEGVGWIWMGLALVAMIASTVVLARRET